VLLSVILGVKLCFARSVIRSKKTMRSPAFFRRPTQTMKPTGILREPVYLLHEMGHYHPENPRRLEVVYQMLDEAGPELNIQQIPARKATFEEIATNHSPRYVEAIASTAGHRQTYLDPDTSTCADSWDASTAAVGGLLNLVDAVVEGRVRNGFGLVRPPGHHAVWDRAMGFCIFNNVAIAARHAMSRHAMERIAIVDWDLHHGNGTQSSFYDDPRVLFISTHQYPHYPGSGSVQETGRGKGEGYTINVPLSPGAGDLEYVAIFHKLVAPVLRIFKPELVLVSAGFDAHERDPLGGMGITAQGYEQMVRILMRAAAEICSGRLVLTLEGGYDLHALRESIASVLLCLSTFEPDRFKGTEEPSMESLHPRATHILTEVLSTQREYWPDLPEK